MKNNHYFKSILTLVILCILNVTQNYAQVQNSSFENWTNKGTYENPNNWGNYNDIGVSMGAVAANSKSTDAHSGTYSCKISTINIPNEGVVGGSITTGSLDLATVELNAEVPLTGGYQDSLILWLKTNLLNNDSMILLVTLYKANASNPSGYDIVAFGGYNSFGRNTTGWERIAIELDSSLFGNSKLTPDFYSIIVSSGQDQATLGSYILVDDIQFKKKTGGGSNSITKKNTTDLVIFPNPANVKNLQVKSLTNSYYTIYNLNGQELITGQLKTGINQINIGLLQKNGIYLIKTNGNTQKISVEAF